MITHAVTNHSPVTEVCAAGPRCLQPFPLIAPGERYVLTWQGKGNRVRRWHDGCFTALGGERFVVTWGDGVRTVGGPAMRHLQRLLYWYYPGEGFWPGAARGLLLAHLTMAPVLAIIVIRRLLS